MSLGALVVSNSYHDVAGIVILLQKSGGYTWKQTCYKGM